jgi:hypothetical protein
MDASILLVGGDDFLATLLVRIRNLVSCTVEVAPSPNEAMPLIQAQQPDLVMLQGSQVGELGALPPNQGSNPPCVDLLLTVRSPYIEASRGVAR